MKSYIKIYGPPVLEAIQALEKISIDMPEVCVMDRLSLVSPDFRTSEGGFGMQSGDIGSTYYFGGTEQIPKERCDTLISKSGEHLGGYDLFFEWFKKPNVNQLNILIEKIDEVLKPLNVRYTITTK